MLQNHMYLGKIHHQGTYYPGQQPAIIGQEFWDQVQAQFEANLQVPRRRSRSANKSLLTGLLYDARGNRFTPSHAAKGARRYRYYVSQAVIKKPGKATEGPTRLPADELEELVIFQVQSFLQSPQRMQDVLCSRMAGLAEIQRASECAREWASATPAQVRAVVPTIVRRVIVRDNLIELRLSRCAIREAVTGLREVPFQANDSDTAEDLVILEAQATVSKFRGEVRLALAPDAAQGPARAMPSLIKAVARAHDWVERIARGEMPNQRAIAAETGLHRRYVGRIIQMAFLAPDITEAILEGQTARTYDARHSYG